jgi:hypothetical protein
VLTDEEMSKARHHLGYGQVQAGQTFVMGVPAGVQTQFMIEGSFNRIMVTAEWRVRQLLERLERIDDIIFDSTEDEVASKVGNIELNPKAMQKLVGRYKWYQQELGNLLQCTPNPYDQRFSAWGGGGGINVPVLG